MNTKRLLDIVQNIGQIENTSLHDLQDLVRQYPYFQTAHLLVAKKMIAESFSGANNIVAKTATYVNDRSVFYHLLKADYLASDTPVEEIDTADLPEVAGEEAPDSAAPSIHRSKEELLGYQTAFNPPPMSETEEEVEEEVTLPTIEEEVPSEEEESSPLVVAELEEAVVEETQNLEAIYQDIIGKSDEQLQKLADEDDLDTNLPELEQLVHADLKNSGKKFFPEFEPTVSMDNRLNTEAIDMEAIKQLEAELKQFNEQETLPDVTGADEPETMEMSELIQKEVKEIIKQDVEKDLESLKSKADDSTPLSVTDFTRKPFKKEVNQDLEALDIPSSEKTEMPDLLKNLKSTVKKRKTFENWLSDHAEDEPLDSKKLELPRPIISNEVKQEIEDFVGKKGVPNKEETMSPEEQAEQSLRDTESIMSETMAKVYTRQGLYDEAIKIYERLGLRYPEKSVYFAAKIEELKKKI